MKNQQRRNGRSTMTPWKDMPRTMKMSPMGRVMTAIRTKMEGLTISEIVAKTGMSRGEVRAAVDDLLACGRVIRSERNRYASYEPTPDEARTCHKLFGGKKNRAMWRQLHRVFSGKPIKGIA